MKAGTNIITDSYHAYKDLQNNYKHDVIKHSAGEYVRIDTSREAFKSTPIQLRVLGFSKKNYKRHLSLGFKKTPSKTPLTLF